MTRHSFYCIDSHACGNPVRVVVGGGPLLPHVPMSQRREIFVQEHDWVRRALMFEPRGHDIMSGAIIYPTVREDCDFAALFIEVSGCLPMCGAGTLGLATVVIEEGIVKPRVPGILSIEVPAGRVDVRYEMNGPHVERVRLINVPSFLYTSDLEVEMDGIGRLVVDIAYGGNFYAVVAPQRNWSGLDGMKVSEIVDLSQRLRRAVSQVCHPVHPEDPAIAGVDHAVWCDGPNNERSDGRAAVFYGEKAIDRSPGGTGTSAIMAGLFAKGKLRLNENFRNESLIGTIYEGRIEEVTEVGEHQAIVPSVAGWARITGHNTIFVHDRDPLSHGFQIA